MDQSDMDGEWNNPGSISVLNETIINHNNKN
jgi:hypothetical protein